MSTVSIQAGRPREIPDLGANEDPLCFSEPTLFIPESGTRQIRLPRVRRSLSVGDPPEGLQRSEELSISDTTRVKIEALMGRAQTVSPERSLQPSRAQEAAPEVAPTLLAGSGYPAATGSGGSSPSLITPLSFIRGAIPGFVPRPLPSVTPNLLADSQPPLLARSVPPSPSLHAERGPPYSSVPSDASLEASERELNAAQRRSSA